MRLWTDPAYEVVARLVNARTGLVIGPTCCDAAEAGTRRAMGRAGVSDVATYVDLLKEGEAAFADLVDEVTCRETYFFRHPVRFEFVRRHILPRICAVRPEGHIVRVWSAGCASGEEAYSLAILFEEMGLGERVRILGTDISRAALARAAGARYGAASLRGMDQDRVRRHFRRSGYREVLGDDIRRNVTFLLANLAVDDEGPVATLTRNTDLIFCRNVLIYFDTATIKRVARRLYDRLAPGGWLITGASDPSLAQAAPFETIVTSRGIVYRRALRESRPATRSPASGRLARVRLQLAQV